jgi:hypothetical protein
MTDTIAADPIAAAIGASHIDWKSESFADVDFLGPGRAREAWADLNTLPIGRLVWDQIGRARMTASGTEWLLVRSFTNEAGLEGALAVQALSERIRADATLGEAPAFRLNGVEVCLTAIRFLRRYGVCCRLLLDLVSSPDLPQNRCQSVADEIRAHLQVLPPIRQRVWVLPAEWSA